jgi:protein-tyrosine phosphatase
MAAMGLSHVCTLLSAREGPASVERVASELNCAWVWLPMSGGGVSTLQELDARSIVSKLARAVKDSERPRIYLHCSAGIHRTGFFASLLLRLKPMDAGDILTALAALRGDR